MVKLGRVLWLQPAVVCDEGARCRVGNDIGVFYHLGSCHVGICQWTGYSGSIRLVDMIAIPDVWLAEAERLRRPSPLKTEIIPQLGKYAKNARGRIAQHSDMSLGWAYI
jgi:hypothetical protein